MKKWFFLEKYGKKCALFPCFYRKVQNPDRTFKLNVVPHTCAPLLKPCSPPQGDGWFFGDSPRDPPVYIAVFTKALTGHSPNLVKTQKNLTRGFSFFSKLFQYLICPIYSKNKFITRKCSVHMSCSQIMLHILFWEKF